MSTPPTENFFTGKIVLIASPAPWEKMRVSKHHYAIEAAKHAAHVYYLYPSKDSDGVTVKPLPEFGNISIVTYRPFLPMTVRFHVRPLYNRLMRLQIERIRKHLPPIDIFWCFEPNLYPDLKAFRAEIAIYHPVDPLFYDYQIRPAKSADLHLAVSREILESIRTGTIPAQVINHGLSECFLKITPSAGHPANTRPRFGFVGNFLSPQINREITTAVIKNHPHVDFVFWGKSSLTSIHAASLPLIAEFLEFLKKADNVELRGLHLPHVVAQDIQEMDGFFMFYLFDARNFDKSNSHKILEYLSTGKVIVSCHITAYKDHPELVRMPPHDDDSLIPALFAETLDRLADFNSAELSQRRRTFAQENTYAKQLARISRCLQDVALKRAS